MTQQIAALLFGVMLGAIICRDDPHARIQHVAGILFALVILIGVAK